MPGADVRRARLGEIWMVGRMLRTRVSEGEIHERDESERFRSTKLARHWINRDIEGLSRVDSQAGFVLVDFSWARRGSGTGRCHDERASSTFELIAAVSLLRRQPLEPSPPCWLRRCEVGCRRSAGPVVEALALTEGAASAHHSR